MRTGARNELGQHGEELAAEFLIRRGFRELARNLTFKQGEIDLLMQDGEVIVVVEVKAQTSAKLLDPIYQITPTKQKKLRLLGSLISIRYPKSMIRIDAVTLVIGPGQEPFITHYQNIL